MESISTRTRNNPVILIDEDGQSPTLVLALIGAAAGGLIGVGYALYTGKDPVKYGLGFAALGGAAGLTLGMSMVAAGGTGTAGALAWGTKAVLGAGASVTKQALEKRAGKRSEFSVEDMAFSSVLATVPVPKSVAIPAALTFGTVELAKGSDAAKHGEGETALLHTLMGLASLLPSGSQLMRGGGTPGPLVPEGATANSSRSVVTALVASAEAAPPIAMAMSSQAPPTKTSSQGAGRGKPSDKKPLKADAGLIHGADKRLKGQTILTAILRLRDKSLVKVAIPNEGAGWRPEQRDLAIQLGYRPLGGTTPGSDIHAEASLDAQIQPGGRTDLSGATVVPGQWAISRGLEGTSELCTGSCRVITKSWGEPQK